MQGLSVKRKTSLRRRSLLILFGLLASVSFTPSEYMACQGLFPDENLDFSGILRGFQKQSPALWVFPVIVSPSTLMHLGSHYRLFEVFFPQLSNSRVDLATILRC